MGRRDGAMVDIADLGIIPRILFATDGAVTHIVEAYAGEVVDLVLLSSSELTDASARERLGVGAGERALRRASLLRGRTSGRAFVHGSSVVVLDRLPPPVVDDLVTDGGEVLPVLSRHRVGTFRETVDEWEGQDGAIAARFGLSPLEILVGRTYEVVVGGRPVAWVTERFPKHGFSPDPVRPSLDRTAGGA